MDYFCFSIAVMNLCASGEIICVEAIFFGLQCMIHTKSKGFPKNLEKHIASLYYSYDTHISSAFEAVPSAHFHVLLFEILLSPVQ